MDTLGDDRADGADRRLFSELRGNASLPPGTLVRHADDKHEPLLWAPDVIGWAVRRLLARDEPGWFENIADVTTVLDARSGRHVDVAKICNSAAAAAAPRAPDGVAGLTPTEVDSARPSLLPTRSSHELFAAASMAAGRALGDFIAQADALRPGGERARHRALRLRL